LGAGNSGESSKVELWRVPAPGASGSIVINLDNTARHCVIGVWSLDNLLGLAPTDTDSSVASPYSMTALTIASGGVAMALAHSDGGTSFTWANLTENYDLNPESTQFATGASAAFAVGATPTITCTGLATPTAGRRACIGAAFR
jgi:hypothetical protein